MLRVRVALESGCTNVVLASAPPQFIRMQLGLPLVLLMASAWPRVTRPADVGTSDDAYSILARVETDASVLAVVRRVVHRKHVLFLVHDDAIIGAQFDHAWLRHVTAFPGFAIMQCAAYLARTPTRAAQIGLGIGTVPTFLREHDIPTDVIEISEAVVTLAETYFQYDACRVLEDDDDDPVCEQGKTFVMDGLAFLSRSPETLRLQTHASSRPYDLFLVDVYTGSNPLLFFVRERLERIRDTWLTRDGVVVLNVVGFIHGPRAAVPRSVYRTLQTVFRHVQCFREVEDAEHPLAANIILFASNEPFHFDLPTSDRYENPIKGSIYDVVKNFPSWEVTNARSGRDPACLLLSLMCIFTDLQDPIEIALDQRDVEDKPEIQFDTQDAPGVMVLTEAEHGQEAFDEIHAYLHDHMRQRKADYLPPAFWDEMQRRGS
ncbi:hypothetical protein PsorP6_001849 [Peronosclerospora sorghi]|uniref:Uncharacterized protein n=1 Tax=Peronosclerospora sorghi TaxID=230839 RepID=A0ACC0WS75_9STRA|nr:hypothetical protein PsorP6_001849 [Peronosclerospora sorghi]